MVLWMMSVAVSVCLLVISAAVGASVPAAAGVHLFVAGLISTVMALLAFSETRKLIESGASEMIVAGSLMRFMGLIWAWAALVLSVTYGTGILEWALWWQYFLAFIVFSGLCLFVGNVLNAEGKAGTSDPHMLQVSRYIACTTLFMVVTSAFVFGMNGLNAVSVTQSAVWAAQNVMVFGAITLAAISTYLLKASVNEAR